MKVFAKETFAATRIKKGFSIVFLADSVNITRQMVAQVERRVNGIAPEKAKLICDILQVEFDDIFELIKRN